MRFNEEKKGLPLRNKPSVYPNFAGQKSTSTKKTLGFPKKHTKNDVWSIILSFHAYSPCIWLHFSFLSFKTCSIVLRISSTSEEMWLCRKRLRNGNASAIFSALFLPRYIHNQWIINKYVKISFILKILITFNKKHVSMSEYVTTNTTKCLFANQWKKVNSWELLYFNFIFRQFCFL